MCPFIFCPPCVQNNTIPWITTSGLKMLYRRGLIDMDDSSSWLWFMIVVAAVLMTALVVKSRSRNWKISIWFFVLGVTHSRIRSGEERVVPSPMWTKRINWAWLGLERATEYYQTCHKRKWRTETEILSGSHSTPIPIMTSPSSTPFPKSGEISTRPTVLQCQAPLSKGLRFR